MGLARAWARGRRAGGRRPACCGCGGERAVRHCAAFRLLGRVIVPAVMRFGRDGHSRRLCGRCYGPLRGVDGGAVAPWGGEGGGTKSKGGLFSGGRFRVWPGAAYPAPQGRVVEGLGK